MNSFSNSCDSLVWKSSLNGNSNLKSAYVLALNSSDDGQCLTVNGGALNFNWVWKSLCHVRRKYFVWKLIHNGLSVNDRLVSGDIGINSLCPLCGLEAESTQHLFMSCSMTSLI